jgi:hypothetical protein
MGVRQDGQKVLLAVKNMGGESEAAWRALLDDLVNRGLKTPELVIVDGAAGLEKALTALWSDMPVQRCKVHKASGNRYAHQTQLNVCMKSSSDGSRPRPSYCRDVVLGSASFWPDHDAQGGRLAKPRREAFRSDH